MGSGVDIYGNWRDPSKYQRIEFILTPCNYKHTRNGFNDTVHESCIGDLEAQKDYLGNMQLVIYMSDFYFDQEKYEEEAVGRTSQFYFLQTDQNVPSYVEAYITENSIEDEVDLL